MTREFKILFLVQKIRSKIYLAELLLYIARFTQANWEVQHKQGDNNGYVWTEILKGWYRLIEIELYGLLFDNCKGLPPFKELHKNGGEKDTKKLWKKLCEYENWLRHQRKYAAHPKTLHKKQRSGFKNPLYKIICLVREYLEYYKDYGCERPDKFYLFLTDKDKKIVARYVRGYSKRPKKRELDNGYTFN